MLIIQVACSKTDNVFHKVQFMWPIVTFKVTAGQKLWYQIKKLYQFLTMNNYSPNFQPLKDSHTYNLILNFSKIHVL